VLTLDNMLGSLLGFMDLILGFDFLILKEPNSVSYDLLLFSILLGLGGKLGDVLVFLGLSGKQFSSNVMLGLSLDRKAVID